MRKWCVLIVWGQKLAGKQRGGGGREVAIIHSSGFRHYMTLSFIHARFTCTVEHSCLLVEGSLYLKPNTIEPLFFNHKNWLLNLMELLASFSGVRKKLTSQNHQK